MLLTRNDQLMMGNLQRGLRFWGGVGLGWALSGCTYNTYNTYEAKACCPQEEGPERSTSDDPGQGVGDEWTIPKPTVFETSEERVCRADVLMIDTPLRQPTPWPDLAWVDDLEAVLTELLSRGGALGAHLRYADDGTRFLPGSVDVEVKPVLGDWRTLPPYRADGAERFHRVRFSGNGRSLKIDDEAQCAAVWFLRAAVGILSKAKEGSFYVARECDAVPLVDRLGVAARTRHAAMLGFGSGTGAGASADSLGEVRVALVDTALNGLQSMVRPSDEIAMSAAHHGQAVRNVIFDLAEGVDLQVEPRIEDAGFIPSGSAARAIDGVVGQAYRDGKPTIINLSLGLPAHKMLKSPLQGAVAPPHPLSFPKLVEGGATGNGPWIPPVGGCTVVEDGVFEALRYVLDVARRVDRTRSRVTVVAAAGNRWEVPREGLGRLQLESRQPIMPDAEASAPYKHRVPFLPGAPLATHRIAASSSIPPGVTFSPAPPDFSGVPMPGSGGVYRPIVVRDFVEEQVSEGLSLRVVPGGACREPHPAPEWFMPAQFDGAHACRYPDDDPMPLVWGVRGTNDRRYDSFKSASSTLFPQGDQYARMGILTEGIFVGTVQVPVDSEDQGEFEERAIYMSGTSFGAAQLSAVAAHGQALALAQGFDRAYESEQLRRLILASGRDCGRSIWPAMDNLSAVIESTACRALGPCMGTTIPGNDRSTVLACRNALKACMAWPAGQTACDIDTGGFPEPAYASVFLGATSTVSAQSPRRMDQRIFDFPKSRPFRPDFASEGVAGPQPESPVCPGCEALCSDGGSDLLLHMEFNQFDAHGFGSPPILHAQVAGLGQQSVPMSPPPAGYQPGGTVTLQFPVSQFGASVCNQVEALGIEVPLVQGSETIMVTDPFILPPPQ